MENTMQNWEKALHQFLEQYRNLPFVEGIILCGSYATGNQNKHSDIDVHIVLSDTEKWRERGNCFVEGFLIEYFINPIFQIEKSFTKDYENRSRTNSTMFGHGKILYDKTNRLHQLQEKALSWHQKEFLPLSPFQIQNKLYHLWDHMDELSVLIDDGYNIDILYAETLTELIDFYCNLKNISPFPHSKTEKILKNPSFRKKYHIYQSIDENFITTALSCFSAQTTADKITAIRRLHQFVTDLVGGFDIGQFKLKSQIKTAD